MEPPAVPPTIYHLAVSAEWSAAVAAGRDYDRSTIETSVDEEGFLHCSTAAQVQGVADRYYRERSDIVLLTIATDRLPHPVKMEFAASGDWYPHVYGALPLDAVIAESAVPVDLSGRLLVVVPPAGER